MVKEFEVNLRLQVIDLDQKDMLDHVQDEATEKNNKHFHGKMLVQ